jgi:hypothetical protein
MIVPLPWTSRAAQLSFELLAVSRKLVPLIVMLYVFPAVHVPGVMLATVCAGQKGTYGGGGGFGGWIKILTKTAEPLGQPIPLQNTDRRSLVTEAVGKTVAVNVVWAKP